MAKKKKVTYKGPHLRNAHLVGKGGGQVKPVDGSFVKGVKTARPTIPPANPNIKKHISTQPAKKNPSDSPARERRLGRSMKPSAPIASEKPSKKTAPTVAKRKPTVAKPTTPKVVTAKKAPAKSAVTRVKAATKQVTPKKSAPIKARKAPSKGR